MNTYDEIPYPSYSFPQTSPAHINAVAKLFGLTPVRIEKAKVLEIACSSAGNIIPLAARFPDAKFVGIDLSKRGIDEGKNVAEELKLENIELIAASITEHEFEQEKFDYIIAHGVYSWVPTDVQDKILEICSKNLSENGVALVSYNTLPGWGVVKTIRDMMLYHGRHFEDTGRKILESRNILKFMSSNTTEQSGPYKEMLSRESKKIEKAEDWYLFHDYLEAVNEPCYLYEFVDKVEKKGLTYLADVNLSPMFLGGRNKTLSSALEKADDPVRLEQYLDFVDNRRFRSSLLVKEGSDISRKMTSDRLLDICIFPMYRLKNTVPATEIGEIEDLDLVHLRNRDSSVKMKGRFICAMTLEMLNASPRRLTLDQIAEKMEALRPSDADAEEFKKDLGGLLLTFIFRGVFNVTSDQTQICHEVTQKPLAFMPAVLYGRSRDRLPNQHHENVKLSAIQRLVLQYVNGENSIEQIYDIVKEHVEKGQLTLQVDGHPLSKDDENFDDSVRLYVQDLLTSFSNWALLTA